MATVEGIFIASSSAAPMQAISTANIQKGIGIVGDRYGDGGNGTYSLFKEPGRQLTIVSADSLESAFIENDMEPLPLGDLRRNIVVRGMSSAELNGYIGYEMTLGTCRVFVHRLCVPCKYNEAKNKRPGLMIKLWTACGVNCEVLEGGVVEIGDSIAAVSGSYNSACIDDGGKPAAFFISPAHRTLEQCRSLCMPAKVAKALIAKDPLAAQRLEDAYRSVGVNFFPQKAYTEAVWTPHCTVILLLSAVATAALFGVAKLRRSS